MKRIVALHNLKKHGKMRLNEKPMWLSSMKSGLAVLYKAYEIQRSMLNAGSAMASMGAEMLSNPRYQLAGLGGAQMMASALEVFAHAAAPRGKPAFGLDHTVLEGKTVPVHEEIVLQKPFGQLKRFVRAGVEGGPRLLIVAPMSGHYATLLRGTVERMLPRHDVYITDWRDARSVPAAAGRFDLDDYINYLIEFLEAIGPGASETPAHCVHAPLASRLRCARCPVA